MLEDALAIHIKDDSQPIQLATIRLNLSNLYSKLGDRAKVMELIEAGYKQLCDEFGPDDPLVGACLWSRGFERRRQKDFAAAEHDFIAACALYEKHRHPNAAVCLENYKLLLRDIGNREKDMAELDKRIEIAKGFRKKKEPLSFERLFSAVRDKRL